MWIYLVYITLVYELDRSNFGFLLTFVAFFLGFPEFEILEVCSKKVRCRYIYIGPLYWVLNPDVMLSCLARVVCIYSQLEIFF